MKSPLRPPRIKPWVRERVETVGSYWIFDVLKAEMRMPNGQPSPHPIYTFSCPEWCNVLAITPAGEAVLIWQYRHGTDGMSLELPGGVVNRGEAMIDGARRELLEETGYTVDTLEPLTKVHPNPALQGNEHHVFVGRGARLTGKPLPDPGEECEVALVPIGDLAELLDTGLVTHALCVCAIETFLRRRTSLG